MKVAVYSLTRDRLDYTKRNFQILRDKAGYDFDHFVVDNGSVDGTVDWLKANSSLFKKIIFLKENAGISVGSNRALGSIFNTGSYDLIIKMDNDCEVVTDNIILQMVEIFEDLKHDKIYASEYILSPRVEGIANQPSRYDFVQIGGRRIGRVGIVGGLFHVVPVNVYKDYRFPVDMPLARGQDDHFCDWFIKRGGRIGYVEGLEVQHYETTDGQAKRYPDYFKRKFKEES